MRTLKAGDIGFTFKRRNLFSRLVYAVSVWRESPKTSTKVSHCFVCLHNGFVAEATFDGVFVVSLSKYTTGAYDVHYKAPVTPLTHLQVVKAEDFVRSHAGITSYSFWQLLVIFLRKWFKYRVFSYSRKDMMCSQFVAGYYAAAGVTLTAKELPANTPLDILDSEELTDL